MARPGKPSRKQLKELGHVHKNKYEKDSKAEQVAKGWEAKQEKARKTAEKPAQRQTDWRDDSRFSTPRSFEEPRYERPVERPRFEAPRRYDYFKVSEGEMKGSIRITSEKSGSFFTDIYKSPDGRFEVKTVFRGFEVRSLDEVTREIYVDDGGVRELSAIKEMLATYEREHPPTRTVVAKEDGELPQSIWVVSNQSPTFIAFRSTSDRTLIEAVHRTKLSNLTEYIFYLSSGGVRVAYALQDIRSELKGIPQQEVDSIFQRLQALESNR